MAISAGFHNGRITSVLFDAAFVLKKFPNNLQFYGITRFYCSKMNIGNSRLTRQRVVNIHEVQINMTKNAREEGIKDYRQKWRPYSVGI